jgi:hypothetical protein
MSSPKEGDMAQVRVDGDFLEVTVEGIDKLLSFHSHLRIPLHCVVGVVADPTVLSEHAGIKAPGARIPGVIQAGTFYKDGAKAFWDVHHGDHAVVIDLADQSYDRLVVEVTDPDATVRLITGALSEQEAAGPEQG